jgi:spore photoproduct lyase
MKTSFSTFETVFIEKGVKEHSKTASILGRIESDPEIVEVSSIGDIISSADPVYHPRERCKTLYLGSLKGEIVQACPGSMGHLCCNYSVINQVIGCPLDCSYCILQAYLNQPSVVINVDIENSLEAIREAAAATEGYLRIGTGELGDSLVYDHLTGFAGLIIDAVTKLPNCIFEFKTKTVSIDGILAKPASNNIVVGFSLNPEKTGMLEEGLAAPVSERIAAAGELVKAGYPVSFHFDPMVYSDDFEERYSSVINDLFDAVAPEHIAWISLGTFRYTRDLKLMMEYNYPDSKLLWQEFSRCHDGKFRYIYPVRKEMNMIMRRLITERSEHIPLYLCMESPRMWQDVMGTLPHKSEALELIFKRRAR